MRFYTTEQLREWDAYTIAHEPITQQNLMKRAADFATAVFTTELIEDSLVYVVCGCGNNGGDGLVMAQNLADEGKYHVEVFVVNGTGNETPAFRHWLRKLKLPVKRVNTTADLPDFEPDAFLLDAILGSGLNRPVSGVLANIIEEINGSGCYIVSVDIPSGMQPDMHDFDPNAVTIRADETYSFQQLKPAMVLADTGECCGNTYRLPIGLLPDFRYQTPSHMHWIDMSDAGSMLLPRKKFSHKGDYGHALLVAGSSGMAGAAILATRAASRSGCGLLSVECGTGLEHMLQTAVPEAMLFDEKRNGRISAVGCGPGIGTNPESLARLQKVLQMDECYKVFDADALNLFSLHTHLKIPEGSIITPHPGEFDRLFGSQPNCYRRLLRASEVAVAFEIIVVLKGANTATCLPNGDIILNSNGNPAMAKGGSGDVLTGLITGLLARGYAPDIGTILGVYLHGLAGDLAANAIDREAVTAGDLTEYISDAYSMLRNGPEDLLNNNDSEPTPGFSLN